MPMNFPDTPVNGATFTSGGSTWVWTVPPSVWKAAQTPGSAFSYLPLSGGTINGPLTVTGTTIAPTVATADVSNNVATTAWVHAQGYTGGTGIYLPLTGGNVTGNLTVAGTVATADNSTNVATTAWVRSQGYMTSSVPYLPLTGGILTGLLTLQNAVQAEIDFHNTVPPVTAGGLWRNYVGTGGNWNLQSNTAAAGDFSTIQYSLIGTPQGALMVGASITLSPVAQAGSVFASSLITSGINSFYSNAYVDTGGTMRLLAAGTGATAINMGGGTFSLWGAPSGAAGAVPAWTQKAQIDVSGNLLTWGNYHTFAGAAASGINAASGPYMYGDGNWIIAHVGSGNAGYQVQDANGVTRFSVNMGNAGLRINTTAYPSDNFSIFSDGNSHVESSTQLWLCGNTHAPVAIGGNASVAGSLTINGSGTIYSDGSSRLYSQWAYRSNVIVADSQLQFAGYVIYDRGDGWRGINTNWRCTDFFSDGNVNTSGALYVGGGSAYWNWNGNMHCNTSVYSDSEFCAGGAVWVSNRSFYWNNNGGWMYTNGSVQAAGNLQANGGVVYLNGMYWQNNAGYMYCPWSIHTDNVMNTAGVVWQNNGGWAYTGSPFNSGSDIAANGVVRTGGTGGPYWQSSGGNMYTPQFTLTPSHWPLGDNGYSSGVSGQAWSQVATYWLNQQSDRGLKQDIERLPEGALASVMALSPMRYRYRRPEPYIVPQDPSFTPVLPLGGHPLDRPVTDLSDEPMRYGFLAQDVRAVMGEQFGGWRQENGVQGLSYNDLMAVLWKAVTELAAEVAALKETKS